MNQNYNYDEVPMYLRRAFSEEEELDETQVPTESPEDEEASDEEVAEATDEAIQDVVQDANEQVSEQKVQSMFSQLFSEALATRLYSEILDSEDSEVDIDVDGIAEETADRVMSHIAADAADEIYPEVREKVMEELEERYQSYYPQGIYNQQMYADDAVPYDGEPLDSDENPYEDDYEYTTEDTSIMDEIDDAQEEQAMQSLLDEAYLIGRQQALEEVGFTQGQYSDEDSYFDQNQQGAKEWFNKMGSKVKDGAVGAQQFVSKTAGKIADSKVGQKVSKQAGKIANSKVGAHIGRNKKAYGAGAAGAAVLAGGAYAYNKYRNNKTKKQSDEEVYFDQYQQSLMDEAYELGRQQAFEDMQFGQEMYSDYDEADAQYSQNQQAALGYDLESEVDNIVNPGSSMRMFAGNDNEDSLESGVDSLLH